MTTYAKITGNTLQYPTAAEFVGVINWQSHDTALRARGYVPVTNMPEEQDGKTLHIDRVEYHQQTEARTVPTQVEVDDYTENPETHEQEKSGSHLEWQEHQVQVDTSYITVEEHHYEDDVRPVSEAIAAKLAELDAWDNAELPTLGVNWFSVNYGGQDLPLWIKKADRSALALTIDAAEAAGKASINVWANGYEIPIPIPQGRQMLYAVEAYASACYCVTAEHRKAISELATIEEVEAYDFKAGYPEHPTFNFG